LTFLVSNLKHELFKKGKLIKKQSIFLNSHTRSDASEFLFRSRRENQLLHRIWDFWQKTRKI